MYFLFLFLLSPLLLTSNELNASVHFQEGIPNGTSKEWNQAGTLIYEVEYKNGLKNGRLAKYDDSAELTLEKYFVDDQPLDN